MSTIEDVLPIETHRAGPGLRDVFDSLLACAGSLLVTGIIYAFHLYPRIPNISIIYLLVVLALATVRGRYAAILAAVVAFLSFDFFLVQPLYTFTIGKIDEWLALFMFLVTAIITGQLASALRQRVEQARRRTNEDRILYELVQVTNSEEDLGRQLKIVARSVVDVFASLGVRDCVILLPDMKGRVTVQGSASQTAERVRLSSDEEATAS